MWDVYAQRVQHAHTHTYTPHTHTSTHTPTSTHTSTSPCAIHALFAYLKAQPHTLQVVRGDAVHMCICVYVIVAVYVVLYIHAPPVNTCSHENCGCVRCCVRAYVHVRFRSPVNARSHGDVAVCVVCTCVRACEIGSPVNSPWRGMVAVCVVVYVRMCM